MKSITDGTTEELTQPGFWCCSSERGGRGITYSLTGCNSRKCPGFERPCLSSCLFWGCCCKILTKTVGKWEMSYMKNTKNFYSHFSLELPELFSETNACYQMDRKEKMWFKLKWIQFSCDFLGFWTKKVKRNMSFHEIGRCQLLRVSLNNHLKLHFSGLQHLKPNQKYNTGDESESICNDSHAGGIGTVLRFPTRIWKHSMKNIH